MQPSIEIIEHTYQNPHATDGLKLNIMVVSNTPDEELQENVKTNSRKYPLWLSMKEPHDGVAVFIAGGWSANNHIDDIKKLEKEGATIITMNGSAEWAKNMGIVPDWQVIVDGKEETHQLVDPSVPIHYFASQCNPKTLESAHCPILVQFGSEEVEALFPEKRVKEGGYTLLGGGATVGMAAISIAFSQGFRELHLFGYDSSYHEDKSHAYDQKMNQFMPTVDLEWMGKKYKVSVAMKSQAERFPRQEYALRHAGCNVHVYGDGYLQAIYRSKPEDMIEREKYQLMWNMPEYRLISPGENIVDRFLDIAKPEQDGMIIDYGCGTGRAGIKLKEKGFPVILIDFVDNCRDQEALDIPFIQSDLTKNIPVYGQCGFCTDVLEHIPTTDIVSTIRNIMRSTQKTFFQISTIHEYWGEFFDQQLHLTVKDHDWWARKFVSLGYKIAFEERNKHDSIFYIQTGENSVNQ